MNYDEAPPLQYGLRFFYGLCGFFYGLRFALPTCSHPQSPVSFLAGSGLLIAPPCRGARRVSGTTSRDILGYDIQGYHGIGHLVVCSVVLLLLTNLPMSVQNG